MLSSSLFLFFPVWRILGEEEAGRGLGPEKSQILTFCWQEVKSSQGISHGVLAERAEGRAFSWQPEVGGGSSRLGPDPHSL